MRRRALNLPFLTALHTEPAGCTADGLVVARRAFCCGRCCVCAGARLTLLFRFASRYTAGQQGCSAYLRNACAVTVAMKAPHHHRLPLSAVSDQQRQALSPLLGRLIGVVLARHQNVVGLRWHTRLPCLVLVRNLVSWHSALLRPLLDMVGWISNSAQPDTIPETCVGLTFTTVSRRLCTWCVHRLLPNTGLPAVVSAVAHILVLTLLMTGILSHRRRERWTAARNRGGDPLGFTPT